MLSKRKPFILWILVCNFCLTVGFPNADKLAVITIYFIFTICD